MKLSLAEAFLAPVDVWLALVLDHLAAQRALIFVLPPDWDPVLVEDDNERVEVLVLVVVGTPEGNGIELVAGILQPFEVPAWEVVRQAPDAIALLPGMQTKLSPGAEGHADVARLALPLKARPPDRELPLAFQLKLRARRPSRRSRSALHPFAASG